MTHDTTPPKRIWTATTDGKCHVGFDSPSLNYTHEYILASEHAALLQSERDAWRKEPESSEAWCFGNQYALDRLCHVLGVDPDKVDWDGSDGSLDEEADSLINRILRANDDADGNSPDVAALIREAKARGMERAANLLLPDDDNGVLKGSWFEPALRQGQTRILAEAAAIRRAEGEPT